ncbi:PorP/SprF family type IX secretion system membrane protein [Cyclobacteriaceae bacterium]|nr:PorP/SprF family type IX secretion system membrane protein [Cyclobacteriaceae bacterium]
MKKALLVGVFVFKLFVYSVFSQDATFSQYFASGVYFNPAYAGTETYLTVSGITRTQWKAVDASFNTSMLALTIPIKDKDNLRKRVGGVTFSFFDDKSSDGLLHTIGGSATFAYGLPITEKDKIFVGGTAGYCQKSLSVVDFRWGSQYDPLVGWDPTIDPNTSVVNSSVSYLDLNVGFLAVHEFGKEIGGRFSEIYLGGAFFHLNTPDESLVEGNSSNMPMRINANIGGVFPMSDKLGISPNVMYAMQSDFYQLNIGLYGIYQFSEQEGVVPNSFELGVWHRVNDAFIFNVGFANKLYQVGFSYDMTSSDLRYSSAGNSAYELSFKLHKPNKKPIRIHGPRF